MVRKGNNIIKNQRKFPKHRMAEDFLDNIRLKTRELIDFCDPSIDIDSFLPQNDTKQDKVNTYQNIMLYLEVISQHIYDLKDKNETLNNKLIILKNKNKNVEEVCDKIRENCSILTDKLETSKRKISVKNERIRKQNEIFKENIILKEIIVELKEENNVLKMNLEDIEEDYQQEKASLEEITKISDENLYLNNKIDTLYDENNALKVKIEKNLFKNKSLENLVKKMKHTIDETNQELNNKNNELTVLKESIKNNQEEKSSYYEENITLKSNVYKSKITQNKNLLSPSFIASLQEVYNKMEDIDNFIFGMMEKENGTSKNIFQSGDVYLDAIKN